MWKNGHPVWTSYVGALLLTIGVFYLGYGVDRTEFWSLLCAFVLAFIGYFVLVYRINNIRLWWLVGLGIALRLVLVFGFPLLSDDVYRFIWDGYLIMDGQNPFSELPAYYLEAGNEVSGLSRALFDRLNSPDYYTVYPPVAQSVFTLAVWVSPGSWYSAAVVIKLFLLACELGSLWLLLRLFTSPNRLTPSGFFFARTQGAKRVEGTMLEPPPPKPSPVSRGEMAGEKEVGERSLPRTNLLFYWLNPLIIVEIMGNLHFEGVMVFFLLLTYYLLQRSKLVAGAVAMAASVASKLLPLMLLPLLIRRLWKGPLRAWWTSGKRFYVFSLAFGVACLMFFAPLLLSPGFLEGFQSSLELYQKKFEFNASLYYVARAIGYWQIGWNQIATIGPLLAQASAAGILLMALLDKRRDWASLPEGWMWAFVLYLLCATTIHPWYLSVPIVLCCFTQWRFPLVWSFLIMLTYVSYVTEPYGELLWLVGVEYFLVIGFSVWEWRRRCSMAL
jgi:hypothetical protein